MTVMEVVVSYQCIDRRTNEPNRSNRTDEQSHQLQPMYNINSTNTTWVGRMPCIHNIHTHMVLVTHQVLKDSPSLGPVPIGVGLEATTAVAVSTIVDKLGERELKEWHIKRVEARTPDHSGNIKPESRVVSSGGNISLPGVDGVGAPEGGTLVVFVDSAPQWRVNNHILGAGTKVSPKDVVDFCTILQQVSMTKVIVHSVGFHRNAVCSVDDDSTLVGIVHQVSANDGTGFDSVTHVPMNGLLRRFSWRKVCVCVFVRERECV